MKEEHNDLCRVMKNLYPNKYHEKEEKKPKTGWKKCERKIRWIKNEKS